MKFNLLDLLMPREGKFFNYFKEQVSLLIEASQIFRNLSLNIDSMNEDEIKKEIGRIKECEKKADFIEVTIINELEKTFITPFDREDIHLIAINVDRAIDILNSFSNKIEIYGIHSFPVNVSKFSDIIVEIAEILYDIFNDFEKKKKIDDKIRNMHALENNADYLFYISVGDLFKDHTDPIEIIKLKEVFEYLESIVDSIDYVGKLLRRVLIKQG